MVPPVGKSYTLDTEVDCVSLVPHTGVWFVLGMILNFTLCICIPIKKMGSGNICSLCITWRKTLCRKEDILTMHTPPSFAQFLVSFSTHSFLPLPSDSAQV